MGVGMTQRASEPRVTHLHFDLHFAPAAVQAKLHVGRQRHPLVRHTAASLARHRACNAALRVIPDERITHYVEDIELPGDLVQHLLVTAPSQVDGARLDTLLLSKLYIPRRCREAVLAQRVAQGHDCAARHHPKLAMVGVHATMADHAPIVIDVHDWVTAMDAAVSIVSHHVELVNIGGDTAATVASIVEYANGISDLATQILVQATAHQKDPRRKNWTYETPYLDTNFKPTGTSYYNWTDTTKEWMASALKWSIKLAKNDPDLQSTATKAGVYTVQTGVTDVSAPQPPDSAIGTTPADRAAQRARSAAQSPTPGTPGTPGAPGALGARGDTSAYWTVNDLTPHHGFEQSGELSFVDNKFSISFLNNWLRWLSGYVQFLGPDGKPVKPEGWKSMVPGGLAGVYDSDTTKYVSIFSSTNTILAIPVGNTPTAMAFPWPSNASSVRLLAGGLGRTGGIQGQDGAYHGSWDGQVCTPGAIFTGIFNFGIPTMCLIAGASVSLSTLNGLAKSIIGIVLDAAAAIVSGPVSSAIQGGNTTTLLIAFADLIPRLLLDAPDLAVQIDLAVAEGAAEEATPIFGWIALAVSVLTDVALLAQSTAEVALSPATFEIVASRAIDAQWTLLPDASHQNTWPLEATHYIVTATYRDGTSRSVDGVLTGSPQTGPITVYFDQQNANRLPAGGDVKFTARFYSDTGWLAGAAATDFMSANIAGNLLTVPQMAITENLVPLTSSTVYQFDARLACDQAGVRSWTRDGGPSTATVKNLSSSNIGTNLAQLVGMTVSQDTSEIGYTWQASGQDLPLGGPGPVNTGQMFAFQSLDDRTVPNEQLRSVPFGFATKPLLVFDRSGPASGDGHNFGHNFWIDPRDSLYHVRRVALGGAGRFDLSTGVSWGRFNEQIDAAVVHPSGVVVGISTANSKLEVLSLAAGETTDARAPLANLFAGYGSRPGLMHGPVAVAATPNAGVIVLEPGDSSLAGGGARLQSFDLAGNPAPIFAGKSAVAALKDEGRAPVTLLDLAVESRGYIYVLKYLNDGSQLADYRLDLYNPDGSWLSQTASLSAARMAVDLWRTLYTLDFATLAKPGGGGTEPSVSIWLPSAPTT
jgi:hypothetical protein